MSILDRLIGKENRSTDYTEQVLTSRAGYVTGLIRSGAAAVEISAGMLSRALGAAKVFTASPVVEITAADLALIGREAVLCGESVHVIETSPDMRKIRLRAASDWTITGDPAPETWEYLVTLAGPSGTRTMKLPSAGVIHCVWSRRAQRPWEGLSPLENAGLTADLMNGIENYLAKRARLHPIVPIKQGSLPSKQPEALREVLTSMMREGQSLTFLPMKQDFEEQKGGDLKRLDVGLSVTEAQLTSLRQDVAASILAACGVPVELVARASGQDLREALRLYLMNTVAPLAKSFAEEFSMKFGMKIELDLSELVASDIMSRARAVNSLVQAGASLDDALRIASLSGAEEKKN